MIAPYTIARHHSAHINRGRCSQSSELTMNLPAHLNYDTKPRLALERFDALVGRVAANTRAMTYRLVGEVV
jgi:hypothetical protein